MKSQIRTYVYVYVALIVLLGITVGATQAPIEPYGPVVNMAVAVAKTALVLWFFMHLGESTGLVRVVAMSAFLWLVLLFTLSLTDILTRSDI